VVRSFHRISADNLAEMLARQKTYQPSRQLQAIVELYHQPVLHSFVKGLSAADLDSTKMMLQVLQRIDQSYHEQTLQHLGKEDLLYALDMLIRNPDARRQIVELYQVNGLALPDASGL